jgi:hypothetical protein
MGGRTTGIGAIYGPGRARRAMGARTTGIDAICGPGRARRARQAIMCVSCSNACP